jgi:pyridoxine 5-phosphate synthase
MMAGVFVTIDPVGGLRQTSGSSRPDPVAIAAYAQVAGAAGIAASLGTEGGLITERDLRLLRDTVHSKLLISMPAAAELLGLVMDLRPDLCVLNAINPSAAVPLGGIDLMVHHKELEDSIAALQNNGILTLILIAPQPEQVKLALQAGANGVVLDTREFSLGTTPEQVEQSFGHLLDGIKLAHRLKLSPWLGGGLNSQNLSAFRGLGEIQGLIIGHSIITQALFMGLHQAVGEMVATAGQL